METTISTCWPNTGNYIYPTLQNNKRVKTQLQNQVGSLKQKQGNTSEQTPWNSLQQQQLGKWQEHLEKMDQELSSEGEEEMREVEQEWRCWIEQSDDMEWSAEDEGEEEETLDTWGLHCFVGSYTMLTHTHNHAALPLASFVNCHLPVPAMQPLLLGCRPYSGTSHNLRPFWLASTHKCHRCPELAQHSCLDYVSDEISNHCCNHQPQQPQDGILPHLLFQLSVRIICSKCWLNFLAP